MQIYHFPKNVASLDLVGEHLSHLQKVEKMIAILVRMRMKIRMMTKMMVIMMMWMMMMTGILT